MSRDLKLELLDPESLLQGDNFEAVRGFLDTPRHRHIGWHYIVDLVWIYSKAKTWPAGGTVLDVGGGAGAGQFLLAEMGFNVVNIDLVPMRIAPWMRARYRATASVSDDYTGTSYVDHLNDQARFWRPLAGTALVGPMVGWRDRVAGWIARQHYDRWRTEWGFSAPVGTISVFAANVCKPTGFQPGSFDAVVSLSAIEHVPAPQLPQCLAEIRRLLRPGGRTAVTTSATDRDETWFHEPSSGLCFSLPHAESLFRAQNCSQHSAAEVLERYRRNEYLRRNLAHFYYKSGRNGMPFGNWDPAYVPIGVGE